MTIIKCKNPEYSGCKTVEIVSGYCEIGLECCVGCVYSFLEEEEKRVNKVFEAYTIQI